MPPSVPRLHIAKLSFLMVLFMLPALGWAATYEYDDLNRLRKVTYDSGDSIEYTYDAAGNIVSVLSPDMPPVAVDDTATVSEDDPATTIDVRVNDTDVDGGPKGIGSVGQPSQGTVVITNEGADLTYTPATNYCNDGVTTDDFTYTLAPGDSTATVRVTVTCVNDPPSFVKGPDQVVDEDAGAQTVQNWATTISAGPANESAQTVSFTVSHDNSPLFSAPPSLDANGTLTYTPSPNAYGTATVTVQLTDDGGTAHGGNNTSDSQTFFITVNPVDDPPVALDDTATVTEDDPATTLAVLINDTDIDGGPKSIGSVTPPTNGTVTITNEGADLTYKPEPDYCNEGVTTDDFTYTLAPGDSTATVRVTVTCVNDPPQVEPCIPETQTLQYSDGIQLVTITASDVDSSSLTLSADGLPDRLNATGKCTPVNGGSSCQWTIDGQVLSSAGTYDITVSVSDGERDASTQAAIVVEPEDAHCNTDGSNPIGVQVASAGGNSGAFSLTVHLFEAQPDLAEVAAYPGDIGLVNVSMILSPVGPGSPVQGLCAADPVSGTGYDAVKTVTCSFSDVPVNTYAVQISGAGGYYSGYAEDVLVVYDPSLGFATGGGWFNWPGTGDKTNFGFTMKYNKKGEKVKGNLLLIRHLPDGTIYRVKSNALYGLSLGEVDDAEGGFGWASFSGKSTYMEPGMPEPEGNYEFITYVEDHNEPGTGVDQFWLKVLDKNRVAIAEMSMPSPATENTADLEGGNIVVPHR
jgi:YD repeat-containing protein